MERATTEEKTLCGAATSRNFFRQHCQQRQIVLPVLTKSLSPFPEQRMQQYTDGSKLPGLLNQHLLAEINVLGSQQREGVCQVLD